MLIWLRNGVSVHDQTIVAGIGRQIWPERTNMDVVPAMWGIQWVNAFSVERLTKHVVELILGQGQLVDGACIIRAAFRKMQDRGAVVGRVDLRLEPGSRVLVDIKRFTITRDVV